MKAELIDLIDKLSLILIDVAADALLVGGLPEPGTEHQQNEHEADKRAHAQDADKCEPVEISPATPGRLALRIARLLFYVRRQDQRHRNAHFITSPCSLAFFD